MPDIDPRPTLEAPDDDPYLWLEEVDGAAALAWVAARNAETLSRYGGPQVSADQDALAEILDRPDNIPFVTRRGLHLYNFWRDSVHVRGLWRRTALESFRTAAPDWEIVLDIDGIAESEAEDWVWQGASALPATHDRAMLRLSRGGGDAVVLREFDLAACRFVADGFALPEAKGSTAWIDRDTLLLSSALGEGMATDSGYARTVRLWRRGTAWQDAPVIFETTPDRMAVQGSFDRPDQVVLVDQTDFINAVVWTAPWRDGTLGEAIRIDLPTDAWYQWHRGWLVVRLRSPWMVHPAGTVLGIGLEAFLAGSLAFTTLFAPTPRRTCTSFFWAANQVVLSVLDDLRPSHLVVTPSASEWASTALAGLPALGVVAVGRLDEDEEESDGTLVANVQDPVTPATLLLTSTELAAPVVLKRAPQAFDPAGLVVTRHEAVSADGTRVPYFQTGPAALTGDAPVHMYGYGGFGISEMPYYRSAVGKLWLERGGTGVTACLRGGGEFGPDWHEAGRREGKARSHDDFAAVAADLVARGVTRPGRIAAEGGSNGGILITNMLTRYPERFGALFSTIPLIDMRRFHKLLAGASWVAEYGNPDAPEDWAFLQRISAYHNVGVGGPPILLATTRRDDRVHPGHARKMAAKLQARGHDAAYFELDAGGHSYGKTNRDRAFFTALGYAFLRQSIGWTLP